MDRALARLRGPLEYDARQRAYGGHLVVGDHGTAATLVPLRLGTKPVGILATVGGQLDSRAGDGLYELCRAGAPQPGYWDEESPVSGNLFVSLATLRIPPGRPSA